MRLGALALVLGAAATPALAQDARIRSGEHETFARLVIYLPEAADYEVERGERSFAIDFGAGFGFDTSDVFYYIPRDRVAQVSAAPGRLGLSLACDCVVTVERLSPTAVYLDVNDSGTVAEIVEVEEAAGVAAAPRLAQARAEAPASPTIRLPALAPERTATLLPGGIPVGTARRAEAEPRPDLGPETSGATYAVAEQIARAAAQGLVDVEGPLPQLPWQRDDAIRPAPAPKAEEPAAVTDGTKRHVSIRSSVDEALGRDVAQALSDLGMAGPCLDPSLFDIAGWLPEGVGGMSELRAGTIGEFDRADPEGVVELARGYVALTFGAEARQAIRSFKVDVPNADLLLAMADIVDDGVARRPGRLATQFDCPGPSALWAALAVPEIPDAAELDISAVALAFSALPAEMRRRVGPILAERLIKHGAVETASLVRSAIRRAPGEPTVGAELLDATIALESGREEEADAKLAEVVTETSGRSVEAVERLIARRLEEGEPVDANVLAAADALIYEHRGTQQARRLSELRVEALARSGQARRALSFLAAAERNLADETVARLRGVSYAEAARSLDDADFLLVAVKAADALGRGPEEMAARRGVARRLGEMGLYRLAASLGVAEGRVAAATTRAAAPAAPPSLAEPLPEADTPLERTAALLEHSAALRERLAGVLSADTAAP